MKIYKFFNIKYITYYLLPIILLICAVIYFHYSYLIEYFVIDVDNIRKNIEEKKMKECNDAGYKDCFHKKKEDNCKKQKYKNCKHKADELLCKQKGYDSCIDKKDKLNEIKSNRKTDEMITNFRRIELLANNIGDTHLNI